MTKSCHALGVAGLLLLNSAASASELPEKFQETVFAAGLSLPTAMDFAPDGRLFVCEKAGQLRVIKDGTLLPTPFLSVPVASDSERGLLGIAFDPGFTSNGFVYVYYTRATAPIKNRVSRFKVNETVPDVADPASELILLDDIPSDAGNHNGGAIHFGADQKLYIGVGDGGANATNSQSLSSLSGKILRLDPANFPKIIPSDNPFVGTSSAREEIWARGLRNPFTFAVDPENGRIHINDVGGSKWEEINLGSARANYGWPKAEGASTNSKYENPIYSYSHTEQGAAITGGAFYRATQFPAEYVGSYFFADYVLGFIKRLDASNKVVEFATEVAGAVDLRIGPGGALYYLSIFTGSVYEISYTGTGNRTPVAAATGFPANGLAPLGVDFNAEASEDPDGDELRFSWDFGDGTTSQQGSTVSHTYQADGTYKAKLTVDDQRGGLDSAFVTITVGSTLPIAAISAPNDGSLYRAGDSIAYSGTAQDAEDGDLGPSAMTWTVVFHHNNHTHPFLGPFVGQAGGSFVVPKTGETDDNVWYRIHLRVTDSSGLAHEVSKDVFPLLSTIAIDTTPPGLEVALDGQPQRAPFSVKSVVGFTRTLDALSPQTLNKVDYDFVSWSHGGQQTQTLDTEDADANYTANFRARHKALLPDLRPWVGPLPGGLLDVDIKVAGGQTRLRFSNTVVNVGDGALDVQGVIDGQGVLPALQRIYDANGGYEDLVVGQFVFAGHEDHNHFHFDDFAIYRLREVKAENGVGDIVKTSDKVAFCITDSDAYDLTLPNAAQKNKYNCENQGISVGWGDLYDLNTYGQWILIHDVPDGEYWLETEANPDRLLFETNYDNNVERIKISFNKAKRTVSILSSLPEGGQVFQPTDDTRVRSSEPGVNHGGASTLRVRKSSAVQNSYLKFDVRGLSGPVARAVLRLFAVDGSTDAGQVHLVSNEYQNGSSAWDEDGVTFENAPNIDGSPLSRLGGVTPNAWLEIDVTTAVVGEGIYSFGLSTESRNLVEYSSKEGANPPELVIQTDESQPLPQLPSISSFGPESGDVGVEITILGNNFTVVSDVLFNGVSAHFHRDTGSVVRANVPEGATTGKIQIVTSTGVATSDHDFVVTTPSPLGPVIHGFSPASGPVGTEVTISGENFLEVSGVQFDHVEASSFRTISSGELHAVVPAGAGHGHIAVATSHGVALSKDEFSASTGGGGEKVFQPSDDAYIRSNKANKNYGDKTEVIVRKTRSAKYIAYFKFTVSGLGERVEQATLRLYASHGSDEGGTIYSVANEYQDGSSAWTQDVLTWDNAPVISGPALSTLDRVTRGTNVEFDVTSAVTDNGVFSFAIKNNSSDAAKYSTTESSIPPELVIVCDDGPGTPLEPVISSFSPRSGQAGTEVEISGSRLSGATAVSFNGVPSSGFSVEHGHLHAEVPDGATSGKIAVTTPNGTASSATEFTVLSAPPPAPVIFGFNPTSGGIGTAVTIAGENFSDVSDVTFNGVSSNSFTVESEYEIRALVPAGTSTGKITVSRTDSVGVSPDDFVVTSGGGTRVSRFAPAEDSFVRAKKASRNYGRSKELRVRTTGSRGISATYLKFSVVGLQGEVVKASLRLFVADKSEDFAEIFAVSNDFLGSSTPWVEDELIWSNAPQPTGAALGRGEYDNGEGLVHFDVTSSITADGIYSFTIRNGSKDLLGLSSKEGAVVPELVVETSGGTVSRQAREWSRAQGNQRFSQGNGVPDRFALGPNYPNPFNVETTIDYALPTAGQVQLVIYNLLGQEVRTLVDSYQPPGFQNARWDGRDNYGIEVGSGVYIFRLSAGSQALASRMILQK